MDSLAVGVSKLELRPGDVLVVRLPEWATQDDVRCVQKRLGLELPGTKCLVVSGNIGLSVLRTGVEVAPEPVPAAVVELPADAPVVAEAKP